MARCIVVLMSVLCMAWPVQAEMVTISDIQMTDDPNGDSPLNGQTVDCAGGIVVFKRESERPRLVLIDPNSPDGWGGIQVKGWASDAFDEVAIGDWIQLSGVLVEENVGTTFLQYNATFGGAPVSDLQIISRSNRLPKPLVVDVNEIGAPAYFPDTYSWLTLNKTAEAYESMIVQVRDVVVVELGQGAKNDNYVLQAVNRTMDPNAPLHECWATDYMNQDGSKENPYMPSVVVDAHFRAVTGLLEQYTRLEDGYDLYQLLTLSAESFVRLNVADLNYDCDVDLWDYSLMADALLGHNVEGTDLNQDGVVNASDLDLYNIAWQQADTNGDGIVNGNDLD